MGKAYWSSDLIKARLRHDKLELFFWEANAIQSEWTMRNLEFGNAYSPEMRPYYQRSWEDWMRVNTVACRELFLDGKSHF